MFVVHVLVLLSAHVWCLITGAYKGATRIWAFTGAPTAATDDGEMITQNLEQNQPPVSCITAKKGNISCRVFDTRH